jgi:hypothetical protein
MFSVNQLEDNVVNEFVNDIRIHEHDFISIKTEEETSAICSTCGLLYCEKCGKLVKERAYDTIVEL